MNDETYKVWMCIICGWIYEEEKTPVTCTPEPKATIKAYKVVCDKESDLPNWGTGGTQAGEPSAIDATTAQTFVDENSDVCHLESNWAFEWGWNESAQKQDGTHIGAAPTGTGWTSFDTTTTETTPAEAIIDLPESPSNIWVREELETGYVPFANPPGDLQDAFGAELYCQGDILNYDNYDRINSPQADTTYYCVALNAHKTCGDGVVNQDTEECDDGPSGSATCSTQCKTKTPPPGPYCGDGVINIDETTGILDECDGTTGVGTHQTCKSDCTLENLPWCGDNIKNLGEECDGADGVTGNETCTSDCTITYPYCGDGVQNQPWEKCDGTDNSTGEACTETCQSGGDCSDLVLARVNVDKTKADSGRTVTSDIYIGSSVAHIPAGTWFKLYENGVYENDADINTFETMPGLAVQRLDGQVRVLLNKAPLNNIFGHMHGNIELYNANVASILDDTSGNNKLEDNTYSKAGNKEYDAGKDEVWQDNAEQNKSFFWLSTTSADDAYYTDWSIIEDCDDPKPFCGDDIINIDETTGDLDECDGTTGVGTNETCSSSCTLLTCGDGTTNQDP